jgi:hypothetical protein
MNVIDGTVVQLIKPTTLKESVAVTWIACEIIYVAHLILRLEIRTRHEVEALIRGEKRLGCNSIDNVFDTVYRSAALRELASLLLQPAI